MSDNPTKTAFRVTLDAIESQRFEAIWKAMDLGAEPLPVGFVREIAAYFWKHSNGHEVQDKVLLLFTTPDQTPVLREKALHDPAFHAALRIIEILQGEIERTTGNRE